MASRGPPGASGGLWGPPGPPGAFGVGQWVLRRFLGSGGLPGLPAPAGLRFGGSPEPSSGLQGPSKPCRRLWRRFGSGFRVFGLPPLTPPGRPWNSTISSQPPGVVRQGPLRSPRAHIQKHKVAGFRVSEENGESRKGRSPRQGHCPSTWRCSSRST